MRIKQRASLESRGRPPRLSPLRTADVNDVDPIEAADLRARLLAVDNRATLLVFGQQRNSDLSHSTMPISISQAETQPLCPSGAAGSTSLASEIVPEYRTRSLVPWRTSYMFSCKHPGERQFRCQRCSRSFGPAFRGRAFSPHGQNNRGYFLGDNEALC